MKKVKMSRKKNDTSINLPIKGTLKIKSAKDKMLETDLISEGNMTIHQNIKKYSLHLLSYTMRRREHRVFKFLLTQFLKRNTVIPQYLQVIGSRTTPCQPPTPPSL